VGVVVPAYNPGERLEAVLRDLLQFTQRVLVVDDGTTDGGTDCAERLCVERLRFEENRGKGFALVDGYRKMLEDPAITCVVSIDADGQHDPAELPQLCAAFFERDADLVIGSRDFDSGHVPFRSRFGNVLTVSVSRVLLGKALPDTQSGYRLLSRRFLEAVLPEVEGGRYETEMELLARAILGGFRVEPISIQTLYETGNPSSHFQKVRDSYLIYRKLITVALRKRRSAERLPAN
jgi:glycosyltransferase involved in cell wall biosynthesis